MKYNRNFHLPYSLLPFSSDRDSSSDRTFLKNKF